MKSELKFKRKTLRQWAAFVRRGGGFKARKYQDATHLHRYENEVIERKIRESGRGSVTSTELCGLYPDLFSPNHLPRAMKRMERAGLLAKSGFGWKRSTSYRLPVAPKEEARADAEAA